MNPLKHCKKKYEKIPQEKQQSLIKLVFQGQYSIKKAADILNIIYASAKNVISRYRQRRVLQKPLIKQKAKRCGYKQVLNSHSKILVKSSCGSFYKD